MNCFNIAFIPDYLDNCVLNSIFLASLYSTYSQQILIQKSNEWDESDKLLMTFKAILFNYDSDAETIKNHLNAINPNKLLQLLPNIDKSTDLKWHQDYLSNFYKLLNINVLTIIYDVKRNNFIFENDKNENPDIIILYHSSYNSKSQFFISKDINKIDANDINQTGLITIENIITFNDNNYKLDSCLIDNEYSTTGINCNDKKIVYNCWNSGNIEDNLMEFDWDIKTTPNNFCLSNGKEKCFSFNEEAKLFVYVKYNDVINKQLSSISSSSINKDEIIKSAKSISKDDILLKLLEIIQDKSFNKEKELKSKKKNELILLLIDELQKK